MKKKITFVNVIFWVIFGVLTGVLWAYANPIPVPVPGVTGIHFRIFAFLVPAIGFLFGPWSGFFAGYIGSIVWALLAGMFNPLHTPLMDGIGVGLSGMLPALVMIGKKNTLESITENKGQFIWKCMLISVLFGFGMILTSSFSSTWIVDGVKEIGSAEFNAKFWWYVLWIGLADIPAIALTPFVVLPLSTRIKKVQTLVPYL